MRRRSCAAGRRPGTGRGRGRRRRARPGRRARRARRRRTRTPPGGSGWRGAPGRAGPGSPRAGTAAPRRQPCWRAGPRGCGRRAGPGGGGCGSAARGRPCTGRRCRPGPVPASPRRGRPIRRRSGTPARRLPGRPAAGRLPCPGGGHPSPRRSAPPRRAGRCGTGPAAPAPRPGTGSPPRPAPTAAASTIRASAARASWLICAGVNAAGTVMSCPASSSRAWACRSSPPAGRAVRVSQNCGPQRGQHQHRGPAGVAQQLPQPGGDPLAQPGLGRRRGRTGPRSATPRSAARCPAARAAPHPGGTGRSDATAATAGSWSRSRARASQQARVLPVEDPPTSTAIPLRPSAAARTTWPSTCVVLARHVRRQHRQPRRRVLGLHRPVHLQRERVGHLLQRPPGRPDLRTCPVVARQRDSGRAEGSRADRGLIRGPADRDCHQETSDEEDD